MKALLKKNKEKKYTIQRVQQGTITGDKSSIVDNRQEIIHQRKVKTAINNSVTKNPILQKKSNDTGLPQNLKLGIENLSGYSMDDVKVHYNSSKPAQLQAHAYAQGTDIHLAPNQEKHLPHEAWHVVQQKQGRVKPTKQLKSKVNINDNAGLEREADAMGAKAMKKNIQNQHTNLASQKTDNKTIQRLQKYEGEVDLEDTELNDFFTSQDLDNLIIENKGSNEVKTVKEETDHLSHADEVTLADEDRMYEIHINYNSTSNTDNLVVSDDRTIAIKNNDGNSKEFYATEDVDLLNNGALTFERKEAYTMKLNFNGEEKTLHKIIPKNPYNNTPDDEFESFRTHICINLASNFMEIDTGNAFQHEVVLNKGKKNFNINANEMYRKKLKELKYFQKSKGINKYTNPDIGNAYAIYSLFDKKMKGLTYHFATVIAKSENGTDNITLENWNRGNIMSEAKKKLYERLVEDYQKSLEDIDLEKLERKFTNPFQIVDYRNMIIEVFKHLSANEDGQEHYNKIMEELAQKLNKTWYFKMYGVDNGTFYEAMKEKKGVFAKKTIVVHVKPQ